MASQNNSLLYLGEDKTMNLYGGILLVLLVVSLAGCERPDSGVIRNRLHLPEPDFVANIEQGGKLFQANCATCHGVNIAGSKQGPPLVHKLYRPGHHADLTIHWAVKDGVKQHHWHFGDMPPVPGLSPNDVGHIISYIRSEQRLSDIR